MRRLALAMVSMVVVLAAGACSKDAVKAGEAIVSVQDGSRVLVGERGEGLRAVEGRRTVHAGAQVKVLEGSASIALEDGAQLEVRDDTELRLGSPVALEAGDLLVSAKKAAVRISAAGSDVTVAGVARVTRDLAVSAATYQGTVTMHSAARTLQVPALRQGEIPSLGVLPTEPEPLRYNSADPWDRRFLGMAIDLGDQLESRSRGFTSSLRAGEGRTPGFYRLLIPALETEPAFDDDTLLVGRDPGETLVGAAIAVSGKAGSFADRWKAVFAFKDQGASWGLVALDQNVTDGTALVDSVDTAINSKKAAEALVFGQTAPVVPAATPVATVPETPAAPTTPVPPTPRTPAPTQPAPTTPTTQPLIKLPELPTLIPAPDANEPGILTPLLDTVTGLLDGLLAPK